MQIRLDNDGKAHPDTLNAKPHYGTLFIDHASGYVSVASPPTAEIVLASQVTVGETNGVAGDAALGTLTLGQRPGMYRVGFTAGDVLSGNASVVTLEVYKNGAVIASTASRLGGSIKAKMTFAGTAVLLNCAATGLIELDAGDVLTLRATGTVGTVTIKNLHFSACQVSG